MPAWPAHTVQRFVLNHAPLLSNCSLASRRSRLTAQPALCSGSRRRTRLQGLGEMRRQADRSGRRRRGGSRCSRWPGPCEASASTARSAVSKEQRTGTGTLSAMGTASPASPAPPRMTTSAPSASTAARDSAARAARLPSGSRAMSPPVCARQRTLASLSAKPSWATNSSSMGFHRSPPVTMAKRRPRRQASWHDASAMPTTGTGDNSLRAARPGSPKQASRTASQPAPCSAKASSAA